MKKIIFAISIILLFLAITTSTLWGKFALVEKKEVEVALTPVPTNVPPDINEIMEKVKGNHIPILMYHCVANEPTTSLTELFVKPSDLEKQLKYLQKKGYQTLTFEDLVNIEKYDKPVLLTFDDGYRDNYTELFPILKKYKAKATIFVIADNFKKSNFLNEKQVKRMIDSGYVSIQSHTKSHKGLKDVKDDKLLKEELGKSKKLIEKVTNKPVIVVAYPNGESNKKVQKVASKYYDYALNKNGGTFICGEDLYTMSRSRVSRSTSLKEFKKLVK